MGHIAEVNLNPWDPKVQEYHGGQEWAKLDVFIEDFSVTTNCLGTPESGLKAVEAATKDIHHYPPADQEPARTDLARFLCDSHESVEEMRERIIIGNGASELIDLVIRHLSETKPYPITWKTAPFEVQYMEYERSANNQGWTKLYPMASKKADVLCVVNPNNPTGHALNRKLMKEWIESSGIEGATVILDESMYPWHSSEWRSHSFLREKHPNTYVIHSWTKLWCCTGLRLGSIVCPTRADALALRKKQVPWSVNTLALAFLSAVVRDEAYLQRTWEHTRVWRQHQVQLLNSLSLKCHGAEFLSWIWVDVKDASLAETLVSLARQAGTPVRYGLHGYKMPTFIRIKVSQPHHFQILFDAWSSFFETQGTASA